jgi:sec-independent protein translocase protein TatC
MIPFTLQFFLSLNTLGIRGMYSIREYIGYIVSLLFAFGMIFEIPIASAVLASLGLLKPRWMRGSRRIVLVLCFALGAAGHRLPDHDGCANVSPV